MPASVIRIVGTIDDRSAEQACARIAVAGMGALKQIKLVVNSTGGSLWSAEKIAEDLIATNAVVTARAEGDCASAAVLVYLAAIHRSAAPGTRFCVHRGHLIISQNTSAGALQLRRWADEQDRSDRAILATLRAKLRLPDDMVDAYLAGDDVNFDTDVAREIGLVHRVAA